MNNLGYILAISAGLVWGTIGISALGLNDLGLNSYEISFVRTAFAFIFGKIFLIVRSKYLKKDNKSSIKKLSSKDRFNVIGLIIISGICCQGMLNIFYSKSVAQVGTITGIMLMATGPIFTIIFSKIFFKEKLGLYKIISLIITIFGSFLLITEGDIKSLNFNYMGMVFGLLSGVCYGFFPIFNKTLIKYFDPMEATIYSFGVASLFLLFFLPMSFYTKLLNIDILSVGIFYALVPTLLAYMLYSQSMVYISASSASIISLLEVPSTTFIGVLFLNEHVGLFKGIGIIIVFVGILFSKIEGKKKFNILVHFNK